MTRRLTQCFYHYGYPSRCPKPATMGIRGKPYCTDHATLLIGETVSDRRLALDARKADADNGQLEQAVETAISTLFDAASAWLTQTKWTGSVERHPTVEERLDIRYRQGSPVSGLGRDWSISVDPNRGLPTYSVIAEHLRLLGGDEDEDGFSIPRPEASLSGGRKGLKKLKRSIDTALASEAVRRLIDELGNKARQPRKLERSLRLSQTLLSEYMPDGERPRRAGRAANTSVDAAVVLLAGCWWLVTGERPSMSTVGVGHFYEWAKASLKHLNPEVASLIDTDSKIVHALRRHKPAANVLPGPWLARMVVRRNGPQIA